MKKKKQCIIVNISHLKWVFLFKGGELIRQKLPRLPHQNSPLVCCFIRGVKAGSGTNEKTSQKNKGTCKAGLIERKKTGA